MKTELKIKGLHCSSCEMLIKDVADEFPKITSCEVNIKKGNITLQHKEGLDIEKFKKEVESVGNYQIV